MDHLEPFRKYFRVAAISCTIASATLTAWFGFNQNPYFVLAVACMVFLVFCSIASDYVVLFFIDAWRRRDWGFVGLTIIGGLVVVCLNIMSNVGSIGWQKEVTSTEAKVHNTKVDDLRDTIAKAQSDYESAKRQYETLLSANGWAASANAISLRQQIAEKQAMADRESKRGGCGPICERHKAEALTMTQRLGVVEQRSDLSKRLDAAKRWLEASKAKAAQKHIAVDAGSTQAAFFGSLVSVNLNPDENVKAWTSKGMSVVLALGLVFAPMFFSALGWRHGGRGGGFGVDRNPDATRDIRPDGAGLNTGEVANINLPITLNTQATVRGEQSFDPVNRVVRARDTAFARRVAAITQRHCIQAA